MTAGFVAVDAEIRNEIRESIDVNMCVEAGAGTGKTSVLVDRIVEIIARGRAQVQNIAVITFTEKAAAELAGRVRQKLDEARAAAVEGSEGRKRLDDALINLNRAHMDTIHAFAAALLRERPVEARLDPGFEVLDELPAQLAFEAAYNDWITRQMTQDPPPGALFDALNLGLDFKHVREAAERLHHSRDLLPLRTYQTRDADVDGLLHLLGKEARRLSTLLRCALDQSDSAYQEAVRLVETRRDLETLRSHGESLRRTIATAKLPNVIRGRQEHWDPKSACGEVKRSLGRAADALKVCQDAMKQAAAAHLVLWLQDFVQDYEQRRKEGGQADFDDLLIWARGLVREDAEVRRYFQERFTHILVDEFQDTDPLQAELIVRLCEEGPRAEDWRRARLHAGSLFVVGDPKQSIYRFRRADIAMYDEVKRHVFRGQAKAIVQNFRSVEPIIAWVNGTFREIMRPAPNVQPAYIDLRHHPEYTARREDAITVVTEVVPASNGKTASANDVRQAEADALARLIRQSIEGKAWKLRGGDAATYRDVAVLIPSRAELSVYEEAFARADVPYRHEGGRTFFLRQEVRELVAVLRAIDDPADAVAAVAALRSSAFGLSDEHLLLHRASGGGFDYLSSRGDAEGPVAGPLRLVGELAEMRHTHPLPEIVRAVLDRTRLVEFAMLQPQGAQLAANLLKVIDQARAFADAGGGGLRAFVRWLKENIARTADETDAAISEETDNVVRIVTIHASKGLQFPIVVFANMATYRPDYTKVIADRQERQLQIRLGKKADGFVTPGFDDADARERRHEEAEQVRLLYVAATRAQDRLVVPIFMDADQAVTDARCLNDLLRIAGVHRDARAIDGSALPPPPDELPVWRRPLPDVPDAAMARVCDERANWQREHDALIARASAPLDVRTASALKEEWERPRDADDGVRRGCAVDFGSAMHALLERIDLARPEDADAMAPAIAREFGLHGREAEIARVARNALGASVIARALRARRVLREVPFATPLPEGAGGGGLAEGRIDLLFVEEGGADGGPGIVIVDFKTDAVSRAEVGERAQLYHSQALIYAWAARRATGLRAREVVFLFARIPDEFSMRVDAAFMAEAEALLSGPAQA